MSVAVLFLLYPDKDLWFHGRRHGHLINNTCESGITTVSMLRTEQRVHLESRALERCSEERMTPQIGAISMQKTHTPTGTARCA